MYINIDNILSAGLTTLWVIGAMAGGMSLFIGILTIHGKRIGKIPENANTGRLMFKAFKDFPRVYWVLGKTLFVKFLRLFDEEESSMENRAEAFTMLLSERLNENEKLIKFLEDAGIAVPTGDEGGVIGLKIHRLAGETFMALHTGGADFLKEIREPDGTYDEESMERFRALEDWMVFDLVCAHPQCRDLLPPEIVSQISTRH